MPLRAARGSFLCRSAALRASLRQSGRGFSFAYPAFTPHPGLAGTRRHAGLLSVRPALRDWSIVEDFSFSFPGLTAWAQ